MRPNEIMSLASEDSRCGEIFVSHKADKWTFFCSYCQKGTRDIGVFICHIRLDHLSTLLDTDTQKENQQSVEEICTLATESQPMLTESLCAKDVEHQNDIHLFKEETLSQYSFESEPPPVPTKITQSFDSSLMIDGNGVENVLSAKDAPLTSSSPTEFTEEFISTNSNNQEEQNIWKLEPNKKRKIILLKRSSETQRKLKHFRLAQKNQKIVKSSNESHENFKIQAMDNEKRNRKILTKDSKIITIYQTDAGTSQHTKLLLKNEQLKYLGNPTQKQTKIKLSNPLKDDTTIIHNTKMQKDVDLCNKESMTKKSNDSAQVKKSTRKNQEGNLLYKCALCQLTFLLKTQFCNHLQEIHRETLTEMRYECTECHKKFRNLSGLKYHLEHLHKIVICQNNIQNYYYLTHISAPEQQYHSPKQFKCQYCQTFNESGSQKPPYVCMTCQRSNEKPLFNHSEQDSIPKAQIKTKMP